MFKRNWKIVSLAVFGAIFFVVYLYLYLPTAPKYPKYLILNQPDESINYFFIRELALNNRFGLPEPLAGITASQVHPRSTTVVNGAIVPIGFPGVIVIFGLLMKLLVKIFGIGNFNLLAAALTPFLAAVTPLFFYGFLRRVWDERCALLSAVLLFFLPPWWYYASRQFQHNSLLVFLIVAGLYFFVCGAASRECCHSERQRIFLFAVLPHANVVIPSVSEESYH
ncbi:MAG: glycosyltransferase family 39 protein [Candidatus Magasanikbacteria bacterium]|nr:glycosyltransferase family 39 protein [Candidatus Magasanikbacteria bacterium]